MKIIHVLPGDSLFEIFKQTNIIGEVIICRECLIVGDLNGETLDEFWQSRAKFIEAEYGAKDYEKAVTEFEKLTKLSTENEINLWFEYELFCHVNLWFTLSLLTNFENIYLVSPSVQKKIWKGFGNLNAEDLKECFGERQKLSSSEIELGTKLWQAYKTSDYKELEKLSNTEQNVFPTLNEICRAEIERKTANRVENSIQKIIDEGAKDFSEVFMKFKETEGIYGFGDSQVKSIYERLKK